MKFVLLIGAIVIFCVAAVFCFLGVDAASPLGLVAVCLAASTASRVT